MAEMTELPFIVLIYSLVVFILIFIYGLFIFIKLRRQERAIIDVKRKLHTLWQNSDLNLPENNHQHNQETTAIQDTIVDIQEDEAENKESFKNAIKNSKRHLSLVSDFNPKEEETEFANEPEIEENAKASEDHAELKNKIIAALGQFDKAISFEHFSKQLSEENSFDGKHNLAFDLIDQLKEEDKVNVYFVGGKLHIKLK